MRRLALAVAALSLSGCGFENWVDDLHDTADDAAAPVAGPADPLLVLSASSYEDYERQRVFAIVDGDPATLRELVIVDGVFEVSWSVVQGDHLVSWYVDDGDRECTYEDTVFTVEISVDGDGAFVEHAPPVARSECELF